MGENEKLGWLPRYNVELPMYPEVGSATQVWNGSQLPSVTDYIGIDTSGKPIYKPNTSCGTIPQLSATDSQCFATAKSEMDTMAEKYKLIADELVEEIYESSQKPIELLSEETAQQIHKAFENIQMTMEKDFPMAFTKRKARKHYKPKFTL